MSTEESYLKSLLVIVDDFLTPLKNKSVLNDLEVRVVCLLA